MFYGTIAQVLPYINGFVMAIKEITKAFALFLGYELPDSSGSTGTIIDGMEDSMGGFGDSIEDANSGLDDTKKKAKELRNITAGIDELNMINKAEDSDSDKGSSGTGAGFIDPRILNALKNWDYMFGDIRMKAMDIRDSILKWADTLGNVIDDNIFKPISDSWNKYGASIGENFKEMISNIVYMWNDFFNVVGEKWKPFFQSASDLFFSFLDTALLVITTIQKFFIYVWDAGGKTLFEGIFDLGTAFLNLATKINDKFVKPLVKWFNSTIVPIIGSAVGSILGLVGNLLKGLGGIISWIADCEPLVITLASVFTALFLTIKVVKFIELASAIKNSWGAMSLLKAVLLEHNPLFRKLFEMAGNGKDKFNALKDTWKVANDVLKKSTVFTAAKDAADRLAAISAGIHAKATEGLTIGQTVCAGATGVLSTALNFLANHPMIIIVTAIAAVIGALALFSSSQEEATYDMEDYSEHIQKNIEDLENMQTSLKDTAQSASDAFNGKMADIQVIKDYMKILQDMAGESGYVDNIAKAEFLVEKINGMLPESVKLTEDGRVEWLKNAEAIQENINKLEQKARLEAYTQLYAESIKSEIKAKQTLATSESELNSLLAERQALLDRLASGDSLAKEEHERLSQLTADIDGTKKTINEANKTIQQSTNETNANKEAIKKATSSNLEFANSYTGISDAQSKSFNIIGSGLKIMMSTLKEYHDGKLEMDDAEVKSAESTKNALITSYAETAAKFGTKYSDMLNVLEAQGIQLTEEEKTQLETSYNNMMDSNEKRLIEFQKHQDTLLTKFKDSHRGVQQEEQDSYIKLLEMLNKYGVDVNESNNAIYENIYDICKKSGQDISTEQGSQYALMLQNLQASGIALKSENKDQYNTMFRNAQEYGIDLYGEQGKKYTELLGLLERHGVDISNEESVRHAASLIQMGYNGSEEGKIFLARLKSGVNSGNIDSELRQILNSGGIILKDNPLTASINVAIPDVYSAFMKGWNKLENYLKNNALQVNANGSVIAPNGQTIYAYANGGFPTMGQAFIANEKGPELIGNIGSRTAVVNNPQIIESVQGGVYQGVAEAMGQVLGAISGNTGGEQVVESHITVNLDGDVVATAVEKSKKKKGYDFGGGDKL